MQCVVTTGLCLCNRYTVSSGRLGLPVTEVTSWRRTNDFRLRSSPTPLSTSSSVDPPVGTSAATNERQSATTRWTMVSQETPDDVPSPPLSLSRSRWRWTTIWTTVTGLNTSNSVQTLYRTHPGSQTVYVYFCSCCFVMLRHYMRPLFRIKVSFSLRFTKFVWNLRSLLWLKRCRGCYIFNDIFSNLLRVRLKLFVCLHFVAQGLWYVHNVYIYLFTFSCRLF